MAEVSIIVPVYRAEDRLEACVRSILRQEYTSFELILVDDGSPDGSGALCDRLSSEDRRIRVIHQENAGPGAARNRGMDEAASPWLVFVDADDTVEPDYLSRLFSVAPQEGDLAITGIVREWPDRTAKRYAFSQTTILDRPVSRADGVRLLNLGFPVAKRLDAGLIRQHGLRFRTDLSIHEDHVFFLQYLQIARRIILIPGMPYHYWRGSEESLTSIRHSSEVYLKAGEALRGEMFALVRKYPGLRGADFKHSIAPHGLRQFFSAWESACAESDPARRREEKRLVAHEVRHNARLILTHYRGYAMLRYLGMFLRMICYF